MEDTTQTIDITPTWEEVAPIVIEIIKNGSTPKSIRAAENEIINMARIADRYIKLQKQ